MRIGKIAVQSVVKYTVGILVFFATLPYAVLHFKNVVWPPQTPKTKLEIQHKKCVVSEMVKGARSREGMIHVLAAMHQRKSDHGVRYDPDRDLRYYVFYFLPGREYKEKGKNRNCRFIYDIQGKAGPWMKSRVVAAEKLFDEYQEVGEKIFDFARYPHLGCKDMRIVPYVAEGQEITIPLTKITVQLWETPGDRTEIPIEMELVAEFDGSSFYCPKGWKSSR